MGGVSLLSLTVMSYLISKAWVNAEVDMSGAGNKSLLEDALTTLGELGPAMNLQSQRNSVEPLHRALGGTAAIGGKCDSSDYDDLVKPIYEAMKVGNNSEFHDKVHILIKALQNDPSNVKRSQSCFGYMENPKIEGQSLMRAYKCHRNTSRCICFDEAPLVYVPSSTAPTKCSLRVPQYGDKCSTCVSCKYYVLYWRFAARLRLAKGPKQHLEAFTTEYLAYVREYQEHFHHIQPSCFRNDLVLDCRRNTCQCRQDGPYFIAELNSTECVPLRGSFCKNTVGDAPCRRSSCEKVFDQFDFLYACGGKDAWCKDGKCGPSLSPKLSSSLLVFVLFFTGYGTTFKLAIKL